MPPVLALKETFDESEKKREISQKATSLVALRAKSTKEFRGFLTIAKYRQGIIKAIKFLLSKKASLSSNRIMKYCLHSGEQHRAVLNYLVKHGYLRERDSYKKGQARYEAGQTLQKIKDRKDVDIIVD